MKKIRQYLEEGLLDSVLERALQNGREFNGKVPNLPYSFDGKYHLGNGGDWTDSFWIGIFYLGYALTNDKEFLRITDNYEPFIKLSAELAPQICEERNILDYGHDRGFVYSLTCVARYKLTGDAKARDIALKKAGELADRFVEKGGFIRAFDKWPWETDEEIIYEKKGKMIVDTMMNLPLLMWAYEETGEKRFKEIAVTHADSVMKHIVRPDYSTYHQFNFSPETGLPLKGVTGQGYGDETCWSRGQAWAIYGFAVMNRYTADYEYLEYAQKLAEYFMQSLENEGVPHWDFHAKHLEYHPWDSSAGAIAASGMLEIWKLTNQQKYKDYADLLLSSLLQHCSALEIKDTQALLLHGCVGPAFIRKDEEEYKNISTDTPTLYGDYFFVEALAKLVKADLEIFW